MYFTYRGSNMGKYTPYTFDYNGFNPGYNLKAYDIWGNYKPNEGGCNAYEDLTAPEFPFVQQHDRALQDEYAAAWSLTSIGLPSGGSIELSYESDDYQFVQDRPAMEMFKVVGVGFDSSPTSLNEIKNDLLYKVPNQSEDARFLYIKLEKENAFLTPQEFSSKYLKGLDGKPIYFRFLMNMTKKGAKQINSSDFDYVTGYFELDKDKMASTFMYNNEVYAAIPMQFTDMEGGLGGYNAVNPISKAGWYFGRTYFKWNCVWFKSGLQIRKCSDNC